MCVARRNADRDAAIAEAWMAGIDLDEICRRFRLSKGRVSTIAKAMKMPPRQPRPTSRDVAEFETLYACGRTVAQIAAKTGWHRDTISRHLRKAGIRVRSGGELARKWPVRHDAFTPPLHSEAWYWLGFLAADGYVRATTVSLTQKNACEYILKRFLRFMGSENRPLQSVGYERGKRATVSSPRVVAELADHGVVPRKSIGLKTSSAAANEPAFWLGAFDGDGCITSTSAGVPLISMFGAKAFMHQFADFLQEFGVTQHRHAVGRRSTENLYYVRVQGDGARRLARLWLSACAVSLDAKRERLELAAEYTHSRGHSEADRWRRCEWCGTWIERAPSQFRRHAFCSRPHFGKWLRRRDQALPARAQLSFSNPGS